MTSPVIEHQPADSPFDNAWKEVLAPYSLGYRIKLLSQLYGRRFQEQLEPYGLTPFHWIVLCCLWEQDGLATSDISSKLQQVGATLTGVIDRMEERNLVRRHRDEHDRRVCRIWLTEAGKNLQTVLPSLALDLREQVFKGIPEAEQQHVSDLINQAIANLSLG
jgi:DNA-binding MarR family transcriptional regulator